MTTDPLTGARIGDQSDAPLGGLYLGELVREIRSYLVPRFSNASARDAAYSAWVADGGTMTKGLLCFMLDDSRVWKYDGGWTWANPVGELDYAFRTSQAGPASTLGSWVPVSGLAVSFTLPGPRKVNLSWSGQLFSDQAGTEVMARINCTTTGATQVTTADVNFANYGVGTSCFLRQSLAAGTYSAQIEVMRLAGPGSAYVTADLAELLAVDMGAA